MTNFALTRKQSGSSVGRSGKDYDQERGSSLTERSRSGSPNRGEGGGGGALGAWRMSCGKTSYRPLSGLNILEPGLVRPFCATEGHVTHRLEAQMRVLRLSAFLSLALHTAVARAQDTTTIRDTLAYTTTIVTVRAKPFANAQGLGRVDANAPVRLYACSDGWCSIATARLAGYVPREFLGAQLSAAVRRPGPGYVNSRGEWVLSPTRTPNDSPPPGASARCRDGTFSFSRSRRGTCSHHGGVADWLH